MNVDFRRHVRPFFLTPDNPNKPTSKKPYYDLASWLATQLTLSFAVLPFIFLSLPDSLAVWQSVYYYGIITTLSSLAFFSSPAKSILTKKLKARSARPTPAQAESDVGSASGTGSGTVSAARKGNQTMALGLPDDPGRELDDAVQEIKSEIEMRNRRGSLVGMPSGEELKAKVEEKVGKRA